MMDSHVPAWWFFSREEWQPKVRWWPVFGGDASLRHTVVLPVPFSGYIVIAYRRCPMKKEDCKDLASWWCDVCGAFAHSMRNGYYFCTDHDLEDIKEEETT